MRYFFRVEFDGARYAGWQVQDNATSVQEVIRDAFDTVLRTTSSVVGAGRTDAGVHARGMGAHVEVDTAFDPTRIQHSVNGILPRDVAIRELQMVDGSFHARFSAVERSYQYRIATRKSPLRVGQAWTMTYEVDWDKVEKNLPALMGTHDFTTFCASGCDAKTMDCNVTRASLDRGDGVVTLSLNANRFLYKMVRSIVGTLVAIGRDDSSESLAHRLAARDRTHAGETAPAHGLVLEYVSYREV